MNDCSFSDVFIPMTCNFKGNENRLSHTKSQKTDLCQDFCKENDQAQSWSEGSEGMGLVDQSQEGRLQPGLSQDMLSLMKHLSKARLVEHLHMKCAWRLLNT